MDKRIIWIWDQFRWCVLSDMCDTWFIIHSFLESCEWIDISQMVCSLWWWENVGQHKNSVWRLSCWYHKWCFKHQVVLECEEQDKPLLSNIPLEDLYKNRIMIPCSDRLERLEYEFRNENDELLSFFGNHWSVENCYWHLLLTLVVENWNCW